MPKERLAVSVLEGDEETADIWKKNHGLPDSKIFRYACEYDYWCMGIKNALIGRVKKTTSGRWMTRRDRADLARRSFGISRLKLTAKGRFNSFNTCHWTYINHEPKIFRNLEPRVYAVRKQRSRAKFHTAARAMHWHGNGTRTIGLRTASTCWHYCKDELTIAPRARQTITTSIQWRWSWMLWDRWSSRKPARLTALSGRRVCASSRTTFDLLHFWSARASHLAWADEATCWKELSAVQCATVTSLEFEVICAASNYVPSNTGCRAIFGRDRTRANRLYWRYISWTRWTNWSYQTNTVAGGKCVLDELGQSSWNLRTELC